MIWSQISKRQEDVKRSRPMQCGQQLAFDCLSTHSVPILWSSVVSATGLSFFINKKVLLLFKLFYKLIT